MNKQINTQTVHTLRTGWKIFLYVILAAMLAGGIYLIYIDLTGQNQWILSVTGVCLSVLAVWLFMELQATKIIISAYGIRRQGAFKGRELFIADIEGYGIKNGKLYLQPKKELGKKGIYLNDYTYLTNHREIYDWLTANFRNLDAEQYQAKIDEILNDHSFGYDSDERLARLKKAKQFCSYFNYTGLAICFWLMVHPQPYNYAVLAGMIWPLVTLFAFYLKRDIITFESAEEGKESPYPSLSTALLAPLGGLLIRDLLDFDLMHIADVLLPALVVIVILGGLFYGILMGAKEKTRSSSLTLFNAAIFVIGYAVTVPTMVNCNFDYGEPKVYTARVLKQVVYTGKHTSYDLTLTKWGLHEGGEIEVSKALYQQVKVGDTVHVNIKPGYFKIPWFYVAR